jgi:hypothetical protein
VLGLLPGGLLGSGESEPCSAAVEHYWLASYSADPSLWPASVVHRLPGRILRAHWLYVCAAFCAAAAAAAAPGGLLPQLGCVG